jgi:hypothetical protein
MIAASPNAAFIASIKMDANENFTEEQIEEFKNDPAKYKKFVKTIEFELNSKFKMVWMPTERNLSSSVLTVPVDQRNTGSLDYKETDNWLYGSCSESR